MCRRALGFTEYYSAMYRGLDVHWNTSTTLLGPKHIGHLDAVRNALKTTLTGTQLQEITEMFS